LLGASITTIVSSPTASIRARSWIALLLSIAGLLALPAAVEISRRSGRVSLLDGAYAIPIAFVLGLVGLVMARRARDTQRWFSLRDEHRATVASVAAIVGLVTVCLAITAALSVGFYEAVLFYQRHR
jgi:hypothetical protein